MSIEPITPELSGPELGEVTRFGIHEEDQEDDRCAFAEGRESAQGEPSDAQVDDAWWKAQEAGQLPRTPGPSIRQAFKAGYRAALRAAGGAR
ncbi:hypothetical protein [Microbacterium maritypicum]